jgi:hypothetical protein
VVHPEGIDSWAKSSVTSTQSVFSGAVCPKVWRRSTALWSTSPVLAVDTFDERRSVVPLKSPPLAVDKLWQVLSTLSNLYVVVARLGVFPED